MLIDEAENLFAFHGDIRRKQVTSCRGALNGYQKGKCFYCFSDIIIDSVESRNTDVDHFFPDRAVSLLIYTWEPEQRAESTL